MTKQDETLKVYAVVLPIIEEIDHDNYEFCGNFEVDIYIIKYNIPERIKHYETDNRHVIEDITDILLEAGVIEDADVDFTLTYL